MMQVFRNPSYRFIENRKWAYLFSAVVLVVCLGSLVGQGLRYDIDFTGGTLVQVRFDTAPSVADVRKLVDGEIERRPGPNRLVARGDRQTDGASQGSGSRNDASCDPSPPGAADGAYYRFAQEYRSRAPG